MKLLYIGTYNVLTGITKIIVNLIIIVTIIPRGCFVGGNGAINAAPHVDPTT